MKAIILSNNNPLAETLFLLTLLLFFPLVCQAQSPSGAGAQATTTGPSDYAITQLGPHSRVWGNSAGQTVTEIATGMNYWDGQQWMSSDPSFVVSHDGTSYQATKIQDPTQIAANLNCVGAVTVTTPDNVALSSTPIAIGLYDAASGKSVIVASLTNTTGVLVDPQHLVYDNAFVGGGFQASVVYSLPDTGSFHQDVVFTGFTQPFDPTVWGFTAASTNTLQIQIYTEFYNNPPQPQEVTEPIYVEQDSNVRASMASPDLIDYMLDFGDYVFGPGQAYTTSTNADASAGVRVIKDFVTSSNRTFLVESVPYRWLAGQLQTLPAVVAKNSPIQHPLHAKKTMVAAASLPVPRKLKKGEGEKIIPANKGALAVVRPRGVVVDYVVTVSSSTTPVVYCSDTTYFVSGNVYDSSSVTMEPAVFKYPTNVLGSGSIQVESTLTLSTTNYRPAVFTAADDNTAGASLSTTIWSNYTGNPGTNRYGSTSGALDFSTTANIALNNLRFCYLRTAIYSFVGLGSSHAFSLSHSQLIDCIEGICIESSGIGGSDALVAFSANNCLIANTTYPFIISDVLLTGTVCNCTISSCTELIDGAGDAGSTIKFTNSILSEVTSNGSLAPGELGGSHNGFYSSTSFGTSTTSVSSNPFQSVAAGNYYLPPDSLFLDAGTTNIGATLLSQLEAKTTQAPLILTNVFTNNTVLMPVAQRDTDGPDLGFHYDPIDYIADCSVSNATLLLTNGVAIAYYDNLGVWLQDGSQLISQGTPNQRNYLVYYGSVQEQPTNWWGVSNAVAQSLPIASSPFGSSNNPSVFLRLTTICAPTGETNLLNTGDTAYPGQIITNLTLRDCEVYGSGANWQMSESNNIPMVGLTNNIFHRVPFAISSDATITSYNNLFYGTTNVSVTNTTVSIRYSGIYSSSNTNENNVFDGVTASLDGMVNYNAYLHGATNTTYQSDDITNNPTFTWLAGAFGTYYQATNSPLITNGSTYAADLGLYQYTVTTNYNLVEGTNIVSRGYHYVGVGSNGLPLDTSGDGVPDYLADPNGNGAPGWTNYMSPNGLSSTNSLLVFTPLQ